MTPNEARHVAVLLRIRAAQARETADECLKDGAERVFHYYSGRADALDEVAQQFEQASAGTRGMA